jgi:hypothetical protein
VRPARTVAVADTRSVLAKEAEDRADPTGETDEEKTPARNRASDARPPIRLSVGPDGRILLSSPDTQALDQLEDLISTVAGKPKAYEVFYLRHASASLVTMNLEEYFEEGSSKSDAEDNYWRGWYGFDYRSDDKNAKTGLSQRRKIRFIYDFDTNSILVSNATPDQLQTVASLIKVYDKPLSEDSISARRFQIFKMQYARAEDVAKTIKEVYRDARKTKKSKRAKGRI